MKGSESYPYAVQIRRERIVIYKDIAAINRNYGRHKNQNRHNIAAECTNDKGVLSRNSRLKLEKILRIFCETIQVHNQYSGSRYKRWLTFATLTLSAPQFHTDKECYKILLRPMIQVLNRKYGVKHYVWRAEKQQNGNIHYHILIDKYIDWKELRTAWNVIQDRAGYIALFAASHGHTNPNSVDIHSIKGIKNIGSYLCKYMSKDKDIVPLSAQKWGCSDTLRELKDCTEYEDSSITKMMNEIESDDKIKIIEKDFATIYYGKDIFKHVVKSKSIFNSYINTYKENYRKLYFTTNKVPVLELQQGYRDIPPVF